MTLKLIVDGIVYRLQKHGGINTYLNELLPLVAGRSGFSVDILVPPHCTGELPCGDVFRRRRDFVPDEVGLSWRFDQLIGPILKWANQKIMELRVRRTDSVVFQSSYFTSVTSSVPQVAVAHDMNHEIFPDMYESDWGGWLRRKYPEYLHNSTRIIAVSEKTKQDVIQYYHMDAAQIDVVHHGINTRDWYPEDVNTCRHRLRQIQVPERFLLYVGGRQSYKNFASAVDGFARLPRRLQTHLVVAGCAPTDLELEQLREHGVEDRVHFVENPAVEILRSLYCASLAFVFPSLSEGFGIPLLEAMSCGTVVLASDIEVFREVADDAATYFNARNPDDIARAFESCLAEKERNRLITIGHQRLKDFSWQKCADKTCQVYQKAIGDAG